MNNVSRAINPKFGITKLAGQLNEQETQVSILIRLSATKCSLNF